MNEILINLIDDINQYITKTKRKEKCLKKICKALSLNKTKKLSIVVSTTSSWVNEKVKDVTEEYKGFDLEKALTNTLQSFKKLNQRSDLQGTISAYVKHKKYNNISYCIPFDYKSWLRKNNEVQSPPN